MKKIKKSFLDKTLKNFFHAEIIYVSSNAEEIEVSKKKAKEISEAYPSFKKFYTEDKDLLQAKGQKLALEYVEKAAKEKETIDIYLIKRLHKMIMSEAWPEVAGEYRKENLELKKSSFIPPHYLHIPEEMYFYDKWLLETQKTIDGDHRDQVVSFAVEAYYKLVHIHPFRDGNGRVGRVLLNLILRRYKLPYVILPKSNVQKRMLLALQTANRGDQTQLTSLVQVLVDESLSIIQRNKTSISS